MWMEKCQKASGPVAKLETSDFTALAKMSEIPELLCRVQSLRKSSSRWCRSNCELGQKPTRIHHITNADKGVPEKSCQPEDLGE